MSKNIIILVLLIITANCVIKEQEESCLKLNCPTVCPPNADSEGMDCFEHTKKWDACFDKLSTSSCHKFQEVYASLSKTDVMNDTTIGLWDDCVKTCAENFKFDPFYQKYYIDCRTSCIKNGQPDFDLNWAVIADSQACYTKDKCDQFKATCQNDTNCNKLVGLEDAKRKLSEQCKEASLNFDKLNKSKDLFPYSMHSCEASVTANSTDIHYKDYQTCRSACEKKNETEPEDVDTLPFSYNQYKHCIDQFVPQCAEWDTECKKVIAEMLKQKEENYKQGLDCLTCENDFKILEKVTLDPKLLMYPKSCRQCEITVLQKTEPQWTDLITKYYAPSKIGCENDGDIKDAQIFDAKKSEYENCQKQCPVCLTQSCNDAQKQHNGCINNEKATQCSFAVKQYSDTGVSEKIPYAYIICKQSCANIADEEFKLIFKCVEKCQKVQEQEKIDSDPDRKISILDFSYKTFKNCTDEYLPQCPSWNQLCNSTLKNLKLERSKYTVCRQCDADMATLIERTASKDKQDIPLFPMTCGLCETLIVQYSQGIADMEPVIKNLYIPAMRDCSLFGSIIGQQSRITATKTSYEECQQNCTDCEETDDVCNQVFEQVEECVTNNDNIQCSNAWQNYENQKLEDLFPYSLLVCRESCQARKVSAAYDKYDLCRLKCEERNDAFPDVDTNPDRIIEFPNPPFSYKQFLQCEENFLPECPPWGTLCKSNLADFEKQRNNHKDCYQCQADLVTLANRTKDKTIFSIEKYPKSCSECEIEIESNPDELKLAFIVSNYYIPAKTDCALYGDVQDQQRHIKATKQSFESCQTDCGECDDDKNCSIAETFTQNCIFNSTQCKKAYHIYDNITVKSDPYPYAMLVCKESCKYSDFDDKFDQIQQCDHLCETFDGKKRKPFTEQDVKNCVNQYCAIPYNITQPKTADLKKKLDECVNSISKSSCSQCKNDNKTISDKEGMLWLCATCVDECTEQIKQTDNFIYNNLIAQCYEDCYQYGNETIGQEKKNFNITTNIKGEKQCFGYCDAKTCEGKCLQDKKNEITCSNKSLQCDEAKGILLSLKEADKYPYEFEVCRVGCRPETISDQYADIFDCTTRCRRNDDDQVKRQTFTYGTVDKCVELFCAVPPAESVYAIENKEYLNCISNSMAKECTSCSVQRIRDGNDMSKNLPVDCTSCVNFCQRPDTSKSSQFFKAMIQSCYSQCYSTGEMKDHSFTILSTKENAEKCIKANCTLSQDPESQSEFDRYVACQKNPKQCSAAELNYQKAKDTDIFPYPKEICKKSCSPDVLGHGFQLYFDCEQKCIVDNGGKPIPEDKYFSHTFHNVVDCLDRNEAFCPSFDPDCSKLRLQYQICYSNREPDSCKQCEDMKKTLNATFKFMPKICATCTSDCLETVQKGKSFIFDKFVRTALFDCNQYSMMKEASIMHNTKDNYIKCLNKICARKMNCHYAKDVSVCEQDTKRFRQCQDESPQCSRSFIMYDETRSNEKVPYPYFVCENSCLQNTGQQERDFIQNFVCNDFCLVEEYTPEPEPDPQPKPTPIPPKPVSGSILFFSIISVIAAFFALF